MRGPSRRPEQYLCGKHIIVTGASKGVGAALARELVSRDCRVTAIARSEELLRQQSHEIGTNPVVADLADFAACQGLLERIEDQYGTIDALVNNAAHPGPGPFADVTAIELRDAVTVNLLTPMELTRQAVALMRPRGTGRIVSVSSIAAGFALRNNSLYTVSKGGLTYLSRSLSRELRDHGISVTLVVLGIVRGTELLSLVTQDPVMARTAKLFSMLPSTTPSAAAARIADSMEQDRGLVVIPRAFAPLVHLRHAPDAITGLTGKAPKSLALQDDSVKTGTDWAACSFRATRAHSRRPT
jgi:NAD(P)-dependent dehydrogenase (short-subunit alcohol dehydrogenase family)